MRIAQQSVRRRTLRRGSELIEFTLVLFPLLAFMTVMLDIAWPIIAKASLQRAAREGVRQGITLTAGQMASGACLTDTVKGIVQANSLGLLNGTTGLSYIQVNYFQPPPPDRSLPTHPATSCRFR
jgi:Flp pilus assembly protein TadG